MYKSLHLTLLLQIFRWLPMAIKIKSKLLILDPEVPCDLTSESLSTFLSSPRPGVLTLALLSLNPTIFAPDSGLLPGILFLGHLVSCLLSSFSLNIRLSLSNPDKTVYLSTSYYLKSVYIFYVSNLCVSVFPPLDKCFMSIRTLS